MPWGIKKSGNKFCVINQDTGKVKGCHPTKVEARQHQKALYANVPESRKKTK